MPSPVELLKAKMDEYRREHGLPDNCTIIVDTSFNIAMGFLVCNKGTGAKLDIRRRSWPANHGLLATEHYGLGRYPIEAEPDADPSEERQGFWSLMPEDIYADDWVAVITPKQ